jgi:hypothetical protein
MTDLATSKLLFDRRKTAYNRTFKKLAVQWSNEVLNFLSSSVLSDSLDTQSQRTKTKIA